ncbi:hypothetical protein [Azotobacter chroococcum]|uniref:Uncharacterized protein n=1 Tax=Azotobacter chroococcum TaxID=353 RepID=A0AAP9YGA3_9GAMM|nr:hypothetical protein [Azotobacter chroococcum]QQE90429.1 hypothetical protein GKQ51_09225 [Azotobacter chroococcum]
MSEAVQRYIWRAPIYEASTQMTDLYPDGIQYVLAADHDHIVAELQAQVEQLTAERARWVENAEALGGKCDQLEDRYRELDAVVEQRNAECSWKHKEIERLRKDADRYRWLRDRPLDDKTDLEPYIRAAKEDPMCWGLNGNWADDRIDAALEASR